jgi:hypothetical protein
MAAEGTPERAIDPVERLVAHDRIRLLVARYAVALDARDLDTLVALFVPDVRADFAAMLSRVGVTFLNVGTHVIDLTGPDDATGVVYCHGQVQEGDDWIHQAIVYRDRYTRRGEDWLFVGRRHELVYGEVAPTNPLRQDPANWPERSVGRGTVPASWPTWGLFWADAGREPPA